jgi:hypothetical protein
MALRGHPSAEDRAHDAGKRGLKQRICARYRRRQIRNVAVLMNFPRFVRLWLALDNCSMRQ